MRLFVQILLAGALLCAAPETVSARERCLQDALDEWYCASDPLGSAVLDPLGRVVCASGDCVMPEGDDSESEWVCSTQPGGRASWTPEGAVCDGECRAPDATSCEKK